jgi:hypothetical protein
MPIPTSAPSKAAAAPSILATAGPESDIATVWRRVCESFSHRPAITAALDHAEVASWEGGQVTLLFDQKLAQDQTAKWKVEVERVLSQITGSPTRLVLEINSGKNQNVLLRSEVGRETESAQAEKNQRESEARQHPMIRKAQEIFGTAPKEIKTQ